MSESCSVMSDSLRTHSLYSPWNSPVQNTGLGSLSFLQGIFPTQGSNPGLPHCRWILYQLSHKGSPRIPELVAYPFSSRSSQPRNRSGVSCIAGRFFTNWAIGDPLSYQAFSFYKNVLIFILSLTDTISLFQEKRDGMQNVNLRGKAIIFLTSKEVCVGLW